MTPCPALRNGRSGFSLLEILMAILLLGISFVGLSAYSGTQRKALTRSSDLTEASTVALTILEKTKIPLSDAATFEDRYSKLKYPSESRSTYQGKKATYKVTTVMSRVADSDNLIKVKVGLTWPEKHTYDIGLLLVRP